ncbi:MAG: FlgD immunoglobulin-like domain containing protein [Bacteroidota bacterium]
MYLIRLCYVAGLFLILLLSLNSNGNAQNINTQAIFTGTVRIDGQIPSTLDGIPIIQLLNSQMQLIRNANYDPVSGTYGVNAFSWDGFHDSDAVVFRIILGKDSLIANTSGDTALYVGTVLPSPPDPRTINLYATHVGVITSRTKGIPESFTLKQNYPNPFNPTTTIEYDLPRASGVKIAVYNILGNMVRVLAAGSQAAGSYSVHWDGTNDNGISVSSGLYVYTIQAVGNDGGIFLFTKKMMLLR